MYYVVKKIRAIKRHERLSNDRKSLKCNKCLNSFISSKIKLFQNIYAKIDLELIDFCVHFCLFERGFNLLPEEFEKNGMRERERERALIK